MSEEDDVLTEDETVAATAGAAAIDDELRAIARELEQFPDLDLARRVSVVRAKVQTYFEDIRAFLDFLRES